jgi:hypothetical protein
MKKRVTFYFAFITSILKGSAFCPLQRNGFCWHTIPNFVQALQKKPRYRLLLHSFLLIVALIRLKTHFAFLTLF